MYFASNIVIFITVRFEHPDLLFEFDRGKTHASLECPLERPEVHVSDFKRNLSNRMVLGFNERNGFADSQLHQPIAKTNADLLMEEGRKILSLHAGNLRGFSQRKVLGVMVSDILSYFSQLRVVVECTLVDLFRVKHGKLAMRIAFASAAATVAVSEQYQKRL